MPILRFHRYGQASAESEHDYNYENYILSLDGTVDWFMEMFFVVPISLDCHTKKSTTSPVTNAKRRTKSI